MNTTLSTCFTARSMNLCINCSSPSSSNFPLSHTTNHLHPTQTFTTRTKIKTSQPPHNILKTFPKQDTTMPSLRTDSVHTFPNLSTNSTHKLAPTTLTFGWAKTARKDAAEASAEAQATSKAEETTRRIEHMTNSVSLNNKKMANWYFDTPKGHNAQADHKLWDELMAGNVDLEVFPVLKHHPNGTPRTWRGMGITEATAAWKK
ncbi:hypothetical protein EJ08DRAFT_122025 [Tothia fuscella]|uniref:Uncharacterized protein n=1 Tax=Tothia fuscella TaxID=1048955 RepID=A0A9P4NWA6_9PEZI|nr:hypothetical protein EJ08DRAFT_122025 [Tothia fuscella]